MERGRGTKKIIHLFMTAKEQEQQETDMTLLICQVGDITATVGDNKVAFSFFFFFFYGPGQLMLAMWGNHSNRKNDLLHREHIAAAATSVHQAN